MIAFHRFLIGTAILFCAVCAAWGVTAFRARQDGVALALGIASALAAVALSYYLKNLRRFLGR